MSYQDNENRGGERYSYSFEPAVKPKKKRGMAFKAAALLICGVMLAFGGGIVGGYLVYTGMPAQEPTVQELAAQEPADTVLTPAPEPATPVANVNPGGGKLSLTELFAGANPAVVAISTETTGRNIFGQVVNMPASGSGFFISEDGYIATNNHVIEGADTISIVTHNGTKYNATLVGSDSTTDLAVLKIEASGLSYLSFGDSESLLVGEQVAAIGNPLGELANTFTVGYISALDREINIDGIPRNMLQTDTAVNSGNSGGPLLNLSGRVIGVVSAKSSGQNVEGIGFAIPSNKASSVIDQLIKNGYVSGRAVMGVSLSERSGYGQSYVYVASVEKGSAAEKAGVKEGDIILFANDSFISSVADVRAVIAMLSPGDKLTLDVQRNNTKVTLTLTLDEYKPSATLPENNGAERNNESENPENGGWLIPEFFDNGREENPAA